MEVTLGDGRALQAVGRGVVPLMMKLPSGVTRKCNMQDVLYVPALSYNLMSVSQAAERGKVTEFNSSGCQIRGSDRRLIANATRVGSLYYLDCEVGQHTSITRQDSNTLWHQRFGHLNERSLQKLARDEMVKGLDFSYTKENDFCETCIEGKYKKSTFPTSGSSRATQPLGLVHSDLCGKINARSFGGAEYFLTFIDDCTHYTWVYMLKHKNKVFDCFLCWKALVEKSSGRKLKTIRTDNGGEYTSTAFEEYLTSEGIRHERTIPRTPEQNGIAERMNRTLVETVRSMLFGASLPHAFWAEALSTAVYLRNRSPTKAVQGMTPYEAWIGEKPVVKHLRVFGCNAYAHVPKEERGKLDSKAKKCTFVGYGNETKGIDFSTQCDRKSSLAETSFSTSKNTAVDHRFQRGTQDTMSSWSFQAMNPQRRYKTCSQQSQGMSSIRHLKSSVDHHERNTGPIFTGTKPTSLRVRHRNHRVWKLL